MAFLKVGLTGGIATGKTHVLRHIAERGVPTIDADALAHEAVKSPSPAFKAIVQRFGPEVVGPDGEIDRRVLGRIVFADQTARRDLEVIVHPAVYDAIQVWARKLDAAHEDRIAGEIANGTRSPNAPTPTMLVVADVPLLYETGKAAEFDRVIVTVCPEEMQIARMTGRDGMTEAEARQRLAAQWPAAEKAAHADYVIDTTGTFEQTNRQTDEILNSLSREPR